MTGTSTPPHSPPDAVQSWDNIAGKWADGRDALWRAHSDAVNVALCRRWLPIRMSRLLKTDAFDEASSSGLWPWLREAADVVETIDLSPAMAKMARRRHHRLSVTVADVRALPFQDQAFNAVVSNSTLDHFTHASFIAESLTELRRVLVADGRLLLTLDNPDNPALALRGALPFSWLNRIGLVPYFVGATFGWRQLTRVLYACGFEVMEVTAILHCPRVVAVQAARLAGRCSPTSQRRFLAALARFESAERWPTRFLTGHFVAVLARPRPL